MLPIILDDIVNCVYNYTNIPPQKRDAEDPEDGAGSDGSRYTGTDTGETQVGE